MESKRALNFGMLIIAFILGMALIRDFDFKTFRFENTALGIIYMITFIGAVFIIVKDYRSPKNKKE